MSIKPIAPLVFALVVVCAKGQSTSGDLEQTLAELGKRILMNPDSATLYLERGCVQFKLAHFQESIDDFDKCIQLEPERKAGHWQRGISLYYAGRFDDGRRQFEGYQAHDASDVENAVWRYMCMARSVGPAKARQGLLKVGPDRRVPMRQVYDLFGGTLKPDDVIQAARGAGAPAGDAEALNRAMFYAHLYIGIYYDLEGDRTHALTHLDKAVREHRVGHYMWDVARVHRDLLKNKGPGEGGAKR